MHIEYGRNPEKKKEIKKIKTEAKKALFLKII